MEAGKPCPSLLYPSSLLTRIAMLHLRPENGRMHPVREQELLFCVPRNLCKTRQAVPADEIRAQWTGQC